MLGHLYEGQECSAARTLELVGERWSLLILRDAMFRGYTRFTQFQASLGIATNVLAKRLDSFVAAGLMRTQDQQYLLTEKGGDLKPVVVALTAWGDRWVRPGPITYVHESCGGGDVVQHLHCDRCGGPVEPDAVRVRRRTP